MVVTPSSPKTIAQPPFLTSDCLRLGVFGGRFDPVHHGHLLLAQQALEMTAMDYVDFVPAAQAVHKATVASAEHRAVMLELATAAHPRFRVSYCELLRDAPSYTIDTARYYRKTYPNAELFFLIGADAYQHIADWDDAEELVSIMTMVVLARPPMVLETLENLPSPFNEALFLNSPQFELSSSDIRQRLANQQPIRYRIPSEVESYLVKHNLYTQPA